MYIMYICTFVQRFSTTFGKCNVKFEVFNQHKKKKLLQPIERHDEDLLIYLFTWSFVWVRVKINALKNAIIRLK